MLRAPSQRSPYSRAEFTKRYRRNHASLLPVITADLARTVALRRCRMHLWTAL
jgi:hypothetical protein